MGTPAGSTGRDGAGAHVRKEGDRRWRWLLFLIVGSLAVTGIAFVALGGHGLALVEIELVAILVIVIGSAAPRPAAERWERGAAGERKVGATLEGLGDDWHVLHDIYLGRGNIDHVVVGPGGV